MRKLFLSIMTVLTIGAFAGAAAACPYSGHAKQDSAEAPPVVVGS